MIAANLIPRKEIGALTIYERKPKIRGLTKYCVGLSSADPGCKDFGKFSTAVRHCKAQLPREKPHVVVIVEGGLVRGVISAMPCDYTVIDGNAEGDGDDTALPLPTRLYQGGELAAAHEQTLCYYVSAAASLNPGRVREILAAIELHEEQQKQNA